MKGPKKKPWGRKKKDGDLSDGVWSRESEDSDREDLSLDDLGISHKWDQDD